MLKKKQGKVEFHGIFKYFDIFVWWHEYEPKNKKWEKKIAPVHLLSDQRVVVVVVKLC